jgi:hypothetical protein
MIMIRFKSTKIMVRHNGTYSFDDGEQKYIPDDEAKRLIEDFPRNFTEVEDYPAGKSVKEPKHKAVLDSRNK